MTDLNDPGRESFEEVSKIVEREDSDFLNENIIENISEYLKNNGLVSVLFEN